MAHTPTVHAEGSQTATIGTTHTLSTVTTVGSFKLRIDCNALVGGATPDILEVYVEAKVRSTGTTRQIQSGTYVGGLMLDKDIFTVYYEVTTSEEVVFKLNQKQGTGRAFPWEVIAG